MKSLLIVLSLVLVQATAFAGESIIRGEEARAMILALDLADKTGGDLSGIQYMDGSSQEGIGNDNVIGRWQTVSGKVGNTEVSCESQTHMIYKAAKKNISQYKDSAECRIKMK